MKLMTNLLKIVFRNFFLPLELTWPSLSSVSMWRLMVCQNPATPRTFSSSDQLLDWPKWLKLKKRKRKGKTRQHLLDINSQMSGVGANVLAADGGEASRVHADCSLHQRWTSAHEWEHCLLRGEEGGGWGGGVYSATGHWKIQRSLSPGELVLRLFSRVRPCRIT